MSNLTPKQIKYVSRCIEKNISLLDSDGDKAIIEELQNIDRIINDKTFTLEFSFSEAEFEEVNKTLAQLEDLTSIYSNMADLHILQEYDAIKKRITSLLEYLATLKDRLNNDVVYNEDVLKKEFKAKISKLITEEQGCSFTQADKIVCSDSRYADQFKRLRPYMNYAQITKTKYDFYMKMLQSITQSVSTATKELNASKMNSNI